VAQAYGLTGSPQEKWTAGSLLNHAEKLLAGNDGEGVLPLFLQ